jgi:predicted acyltransferase
MVQKNASNALQIGEPAISPAFGDRVVAIDALRGFDMFWIVGGGDGGGKLLLLAVAYIWGSTPSWLEHQLEHVAWEGFTAWDLIMPLFLFVVGAAMPFSFSRRMEEGQSKAGLYWKIIRRTVILFILGMIVQGHLLDFNLSTLHVFCNTLQAIAAGYLVAGFVILNVGIFGQVLVTLLLLIAYWLLLRFVPFGGHPAGTLEPNANLALTVDTFILGRFRDGTTYTWVLSSLGFAATTMLGVMSGHVLRSNARAWQKLLTLIAAGLGCLAAGWAWSEWGGLPIIKHIWTSSMVLWAAGWSFLLLALFYFLIDMIGWRWWAFPFVVIGMNAITIYVANRFIPFLGISESLVGGAASHAGKAGPLIVQFTAVLLAWLLLYHLYRQKIFLRI